MTTRQDPESAEEVEGESLFIANTKQSTTLVDRINEMIDMPLRDSNGQYIPVGRICDVGEWQYDDKDLFGEGSSCQVYHSLKGSLQAAVKVSLYESDNGLEKFRREEAMLTVLDHPRIPKLHCTKVDDGIISLVIEYRGDSLYKQWKNISASKSPQSKALRMRIMRQLVEVLEYLHSNQIYHRDIRTGNITLEKDEISLIDFGNARTGSPSNLKSESDDSNRTFLDSKDWHNTSELLERLELTNPFPSDPCNPYITELQYEQCWADPDAEDLYHKLGFLDRSGARNKSQWTYDGGNIDDIKNHPYLKEEQKA